VAALARTTRIAPRELLGLTTREYQQAQFTADGVLYDLAEEVRAHLVELALAEQREIEEQTGRRAPQPRRRPAWKGGEVTDVRS